MFENCRRNHATSVPGISVRSLSVMSDGNPHCTHGVIVTRGFPGLQYHASSSSSSGRRRSLARHTVATTAVVSSARYGVTSADVSHNNWLRKILDVRIVMMISSAGTPIKRAASAHRPVSVKPA